MSHKKLLINSMSNTVNLIVNLSVTFMMTPVFLKFLGNHDYGIWEIIFIVFGYMGLLDLGIRSAVVRFVAIYRGQNDSNTINTLYSTSLLFMVSVGILLMLAFFIWSNFNPSMLSQGKDDIDKYSTFLITIGFCLPFIFGVQIAEAILEGKQLYFHKSLTNIIVRVISSLYLYYHLSSKNGLLLLSSVLLCTVIIRYFIFTLLLYFSKDSSTPLKKPSLTLFIMLIKYGSKSLANGVAYSLQTTSAVFLISLLLGPAIIPLYSIPKALINYVTTFMTAITRVFLPFFTEQKATDKLKELRESYVLYSKLLIWFLVTSITFILLFGSDFIYFWLSGQFEREKVQVLMYLFSLALIINKLNPLGNDVAAALNRHGIFAKLRTVSAASVFILGYVLIKTFGIQGVIIAEIIVMGIIIPLLLKYCCDFIKLKVSDYFRYCWRNNILVFFFLFIEAYMFKKLFPAESLYDTFIALANTAIASLLIFYFLGLNKNEKSFVIINSKQLLDKTLNIKNNK